MEKTPTLEHEIQDMTEEPRVPPGVDGGGVPSSSDSECALTGAVEHEQPAAPAASRASFENRSRFSAARGHIAAEVTGANKQLWLILSVVVLAAAMNYLVTAHRVILGFYTLPTLFSAYFFGRYHATLTALVSVCLVSVLAQMNPTVLASVPAIKFLEGRWYDVVSWGGMLVITAYAMGTLHEKHQARVRELRQTYHGLLLILRQFISKDKYTENHSYRVSIYASRIAAYMGFNSERIEDVRAASLLHDIGKLETSRHILYKAARLSQQEYTKMKRHAEKGAALLEPVGGPLHRIIPIVLAHHDKFDGSGYHGISRAEIPLEARIISVADVYDALTSDRPYRKAMSPFDARETIVKGAGTEFDPEVVDAFLQAFRKGEMEVPELVV